MKFCYLDESATGDEPYAVMVGVIVDTYRMRVTKKDWAELLEALSQIVEKPLLEIHTSDFYSGNGVWRTLPGDLRARIISVIFNWLKARNHKIVYSAVDKTKFNSEFNKESHANEVRSLWRFMALHICLAIQKYLQGREKNKGNTVLIFDHKKTEADEFIKLIRNPPEWTDTYYHCDQKQDRLDQIIDVPYFGDSRHVGLIQVADFVSFFLRKYVEIQMGVPPDYEDEPSRIEGWAKTALAQSIPKPTIYLRKGRCECADLFYRYAPSCLL
jgi:hypothetical protein